jgi:hypothetical protein
MRNPPDPLIPANAGTQITERRLREQTASLRHQRSAQRHLGPGIRRDERNF